MHVNAEDLVDIADGTRPEGSAPHLATCEPCRVQLRDLRAMIAEARAVDVPEPSPLFWAHLSSRVSEAVAADQDTPLNAWLFFARLRRVHYGWFAAAAMLALLLGSRGRTPVQVLAPPALSVAEVAVAPDLLSDVDPDGDASLTLVASLTDDVDLETAREAGLAPRGSAEHAVTHLSDNELRELRRLLNAELTRSGA